VTERSGWTPYPHEEVRVHRLWRKRILIGLILASLFLVWALSLGVTTDTTEQVQVYGEDGDEVTVQRPEDDRQRPAATIELSPGETARLDEDLEANQEETQRQGQSASVPERPDGIPFFGILLLVGPFLVALWAYRYLATQGDATEANYGIYTGPMPYEMITSGHQELVKTGEHVEENPFGKRRRDYLRETMEPRRRFRELDD
jgi:hypothetical protein